VEPAKPWQRANQSEQDPKGRLRLPRRRSRGLVTQGRDQADQGRHVCPRSREQSLCRCLWKAIRLEVGGLACGPQLDPAASWLRVATDQQGAGCLPPAQIAAAGIPAMSIAVKPFGDRGSAVCSVLRIGAFALKRQLGARVTSRGDRRSKSCSAPLSADPLDGVARFRFGPDSRWAKGVAKARTH